MTDLPYSSQHLTGESAADAAAPVAVIDIGSNSGRVAVVRSSASGHMDVVEDVRASLRLVESVDQDGWLHPDVVAHLFEALRDFRAVAVRAGAGRIVAVATAAVREATNGAEVIERIRQELGFEVQAITAEEEARYAFLGATHGLANDHGMLVDMGGGSMQIVQFTGRAFTRYWTLPLGALRLSGKFLLSDPPARGERRKLVDHVQDELERAGIPALGAGEQLIGTGGSIRNLARIDRRARKFPNPRLHGYQLDRGRLEDVTDVLVEADTQNRLKVPGLNTDRVDSIVGGALAIHTLMRTLKAKQLLVSGGGLREGVAMTLLGLGAADPPQVRAAAIETLVRRFCTWNPVTAARRKQIALAILAALEPNTVGEVRDLVGFAATMLDIGRNVDYYNRYEHTAEIASETDLAGFSPRAVALLVGMLARTDRMDGGLKGYRPLLNMDDEAAVTRWGRLLVLTDEVERRLPVGAPPVTAWKGADGVLTVQAQLPEGVLMRDLLRELRGTLGDVRIVA